MLLLWGHRRSRRAVEGLSKRRELGEATNDAELARRMLVRHDGVERRLLTVNLTPRLCERDEEEPLLGLHARAQLQNFYIFQDVILEYILHPNSRINIFLYYFIILILEWDLL